jgi:hypothetical protein
LLHCEAKAHAVQALSVREGLDLRRCTAYSDSVNDLPMLSVVGTAVAVNPDQRLRDHARRHSWEIRDFRTGRKAAKIGGLSVLGIGVLVAAVAARMAHRRRRQLIPLPVHNTSDVRESPYFRLASPTRRPRP